MQNSAQFVRISAKILRKFASIFVSTGRRFDWWRPAWKAPEFGQKSAKRCLGMCSEISTGRSSFGRVGYLVICLQAGRGGRASDGEERRRSAISGR